MTVRLYDTKAQALRDFVPLDPANVTVYVCGPTVQSGSAHRAPARRAELRHPAPLARAPLRPRHLRAQRHRHRRQGARQRAPTREPWWALAYRMELEFSRAYAAIGIRPPTYEPRATASIPQMQELIERLIDARARLRARHGDVYFDVRSWPAYGELTRQSLDAMEPAEDADPRGKRDPRDFALWKGAKPDEPESARRGSRRGAPGRPGWHIECSAMSRRYLGPEFDIHGGGLDLRFPHHENELAQSTAAGDAVRAVLGAQRPRDRRRPEDVEVARQLPARRGRARASATRSSCATRSPPRTTGRASTSPTSSFDEAEAALERIRGVPAARRPRRCRTTTATCASTASCPTRFAAAMDDDLGVPQALAVIHETRARRQHRARRGRSRRGARARSRDVAVMTGILGIDPLDPRVAIRRGSAPRHPLSTPSSRRMITQRADARAAKDWAAADRIRDADRRGGHRARRHRRRHALDIECAPSIGELMAGSKPGRPGASKGARRAPRRAPAARTSAPSRVADRPRRPRTAPGTPPASARRRSRALRRGGRQGQAGRQASGANRSAARQEGRRHRGGHRPQLGARGAAREDPRDGVLHRPARRDGRPRQGDALDRHAPRDPGDGGHAPRARPHGRASTACTRASRSRCRRTSTRTRRTCSSRSSTRARRRCSSRSTASPTRATSARSSARPAPSAVTA